MSEISLTASMRSNLLSLQQIAKLQDSTQLRLSTGLKVNSAIDNPSSYYTASSLNNRAEDLSALLDSMGQSVQTIKAATEGIEKAEDLLSQMKAIAEQVNTGVYVPEKSYFEKLVGENGVVVSTAEELRAAVDSGKEEICVYGKIDLGDISTTGGLNLQANQKLVGVNYYGNFGSEGEEFSSISATSSAVNNMINITKTGCLVSDLSLNYENSADNANSFVINTSGKDVVSNLSDLNIVTNFSDTSTVIRSAIYCQSNARTEIKDSINIEVDGFYGYGISGSNIEILSGAKVNIKTYGDQGVGIRMFGGYFNLNSNASIGITSAQSGGVSIQSNTIFSMFSNSMLNIKSTNGGGISCSLGGTYNILNGANLKISSATTAISIGVGGKAVLSGNISLQTSGANYGINIGADTAVSGDLSITSEAQIYFNTSNYALTMSPNYGNVCATMQIAKGAKIAFEKDGNTSWYQVKDDYHDENDSGANKTITMDNFETTLSVGTTNAWKTAGDVVAELEQEKAAQAEKEAEEQANREVYQKQYNNALSQYDSLIKDSSYKGVNLLQADDLKVIFNENRSSTLEVSGVDLSSDKIGMMTADWSKAKDVQNSINQVIEAKNTLRSASTKLGNYYSIITERETFTDNLINVLEEGADKLTLADMNEESANMLSLQTQQQLAINSLSLASQASQAVLRLF